jgi:hypothetical protein
MDHDDARTRVPGTSPHAASATGRPLSFQWMPSEMVDTLDQPGPQFFGKSNDITFNGLHIATDDVIQFLSPVQGFLWTGRRVS